MCLEKMGEILGGVRVDKAENSSFLENTVTERRDMKESVVRAEGRDSL